MSVLTLAAQDSASMFGREIKHSIRLLRLLIVSAVVVPVVMLLLFDYILGGTIGHGLGDAARGAPYIDFLVPGILIITIAGGCGPTAINVSMDMTGGFVDRIRTMAVTRGAVLAGHVGVSVLRMLAGVAVVTAVALLLGFRPKASVGDWFAVVGIAAAFSFALAWLSAALGHYHKRGLLEEPPRDSSGYRRYTAQHAIDLLKIKTLAEAGVPLARVKELLAASPDRFAAAITEVDRALQERAKELRRTRERIARLTAGDRLFVSTDVADYLDRLSELGVSRRAVKMERDGWILLQSASPKAAAVGLADKLRAIEEPEFGAVYLAYDAAFG